MEAPEENVEEVTACEVETPDPIEEQTHMIESMKADRDKHIKLGQTNLLLSIQGVRERMLTIEGVEEAYRILKELGGSPSLSIAARIARDVHESVAQIEEGLKKEDFNTAEGKAISDILFKDFDKDIATKNRIDKEEYVYQVMLSHVIRQVHAAAMDIIDFREHTNADIEKAEAKLKELEEAKAAEE